MSDDLYDAACAFIDAGWSPIPLRGKVPVTKGWADGVASSKADAYGWWVEDAHDGIGVACGAVSGGLVVVDIEGRLVADTERMARVMAHAAQTGVDAIIAAAAGQASASTPSGGLHLFLRITDAPVPGNTKLAYASAPGTPGGFVLLVETRGEGGQVAVPPGPGRAWLNGSLPGSSVDVTMDEYARVLGCFRVLDESQRLTHAPRPAKPKERLGGVFDTSHDGPTVASAFADALMAGEVTWADVLDPGWTHTGYDREGRSLWLRPEYGGVKSTALSSAHGFERYHGAPTPVLVVHSASVERLPTGDGQRLTPARVWALSHGYSDEATAYAALETAMRDGDADILELLPGPLLPRLAAIVEAKTPVPAAPTAESVAQLADTMSPSSGEVPVDVASADGPAPLEATTQLDLATLPKVMREAVETVAAATQTAPEIGALIAVAALSAASGNGYRFRAPGWTEVPCLWTASGADPSERKSSVISLLAVRPMLAAQKAVGDRIASTIREHAERAVWLEAAVVLAKESLKSAKSPDAREAASAQVAGAIAALGDHAESKPATPHILATEGTPEALLDVMSENGGTAVIFTAEGSFMETVTGGYSDKGRPSPMLAALNSAWSGEMIRSRRRQSKAVDLDHPFLAVGLAVQPAVLMALSSSRLTGNGFTARWLLAQPPRLAGRRTTSSPALDELALSRWTSTLSDILARGWAASGAPEHLDLTEAARVRFVDWWEHCERQIASSDEDTRAWWGKAHGQTIRVAGLFQLAIAPHSSAISDEAMRLAVGFMAWSAAATTELLGGRLSRMGDISAEGAAEPHRDVLMWAKRRRPGQWFRVRDFMRSVRQPGWTALAGEKPADVVTTVCDELALIGLLERREVATSKTGVGQVAEYLLVGQDAERPTSSPTSNERPTSNDDAGRASRAGRKDNVFSSSSSIETQPDTSIGVSAPLSTPSPARRARLADQPDQPRCATCGGRLDSDLAAAGIDVHPACPERGQA